MSSVTRADLDMLRTVAISAEAPGAGLHLDLGAAAVGVTLAAQVLASDAQRYAEVDNPHSAVTASLMHRSE